MLITDELFASFFRCETKSYLTAHIRDAQYELPDLQHRILDDYIEKCRLRLVARAFRENVFVGTLSPELISSRQYSLIFDCALGSQTIQSRFHALTRSTSAKGKPETYIPIRFVHTERVGRHDKLLLAFDALVMSMVLGEMPPFGRIIHGAEYKATKIDLAELIKSARTMVESISTQLSSKSAPELILNQHCTECGFQQRCRQVAVDKDDLSLLSRMTEKERKKLHSRGVFSVTQLSHTFRPRRRPKREVGLPKKHNLALQALAIRERKIHVDGKPNFALSGTPVYLDVESVPDRQFYYLIGLRTGNGIHFGRMTQCKKRITGRVSSKR